MGDTTDQHTLLSSMSYSNVWYSVLKLWKQGSYKMAATAGLEGPSESLLLLTCSVQARDGLLHHLQPYNHRQVAT